MTTEASTLAPDSTPPDSPSDISQQTIPVPETPPVAAPVQPEAQAAPSTPEPAKAPEPPITDGASLLPFDPSQLSPQAQQYIDQLRSQATAAQQQADQRILDQTIQQYAQSLEQQHGLEPTVAQAIAAERGQLLYRQYQSEQARQGQINAAFAIGRQYGVDPRTLLNLPSPDAMRQAAMGASATSKQAQELAALRAEVAALKRGAVPAQPFETGLVAGQGNLSGDVLEKAWLKFDVEHPDQANPYAAKYRAMLAS